MNIPLIVKYGMGLAGLWRVENEADCTTVTIKEDNRKVVASIVGHGRYHREWELRIFRPEINEIKHMPIADAANMTANDGDRLFKRMKAEMYGVAI